MVPLAPFCIVILDCNVVPLRFVILSGASALPFRRIRCGGRMRSRRTCCFFAPERCCLGRTAMVLDLHCVRTGLPKAGPSTSFGRWPHSAQDDKAFLRLRSFWQSTRYSADKRCQPLHRQNPAANLSRIFRTQTHQVLWLPTRWRSVSSPTGFLSVNLLSNDACEELFAHEMKVL
jgi:hypothetical protein